jgi:hypothetical protein
VLGNGVAGDGEAIGGQQLLCLLFLSCSVKGVDGGSARAGGFLVTKEIPERQFSSRNELGIVSGGGVHGKAACWKKVKTACLK